MHNRRAILYFSSFSTTGWGGQESLWSLVSRLDRQEFRPVVVLPQAGSLSERLRDHKVDVRLVDLPKVTPGNTRSIIEAMRKLLSIIDQERIAMLHTDGPRNTFYAGVAGKLKAKPVLWHVRTSSADIYDRLLYLLCSKIILVADGLLHRFRFSTPGHKLVTIHNGVDVEQFAPRAGNTRSHRCFGLRPDDVLITVSARIEEFKGQRYLIEACSQLRHIWSRLHLVFAGGISEPAYYRACVQRINELGLADHVHFIGQVDHIPQLLQDTDIVVLPSIASEAFSRSILEAMASGIPVVATDCGGTREAVEHGVSGYVVAPRDSVEMARRIAALSEDEAMRRRMGQAGRKIAVERFRIERNVARTEAVYREMLQGAEWRDPGRLHRGRCAGKENNVLPFQIGFMRARYYQGRPPVNPSEASARSKGKTSR